MSRSVATDRLAEDVRVLSIVVAELEFRDIQRKIFAADFVIGADSAALNQAPEAFDGVGVDRAHDISPLGVIDHAMDLQGTDAFLAGEHHVDGAEPCTHGVLRVLRNGEVT